MPEYNPELIDREVAFFKPNYKGVTQNDEIRKELRARNVEEHNIRFVIRELERDYKPPSPKLYSWWLMIAGTILLLLSVFLFKIFWIRGYIHIHFGLIGVAALMLFSGFKGLSRK